MDIDVTIALHGRAPACATGIKRMRPDVTVWTMQGDGDMASEGLAEILHAAARGEKITCFLLNNGVFGDTGGQMTAATVLGQRTKTSTEGRDAALHGHPLALADMLAALPGVGYAARGAVHNAAGITAARKLVRNAFRNQHEGKGLALVEILTMCPTGWFVPTATGPGYMMDSLGQAYPLGELKGM
jgi:2-oxoglutarate ferredoxin oxidoreductase subunit beta